MEIRLWTEMSLLVIGVLLFVLCRAAAAGKQSEADEIHLKFEYDKGNEVFNMSAAAEYLANNSAHYDHSKYRKRGTTGFRVGHSTTTNTCNQVRGVPSDLRSADVMRPDGLFNFYQKYTETYGIPILGSTHVPDDALKRACYTVRFMLADHAGIRESFYKLSGRVAIMAVREVTLDIPEHSHLDHYMNQRIRGLGATIHSPVSTGAEENVLCQAYDRYHPEDNFLHEFAHSIAVLGASVVIPNWQQKLTQIYNHAYSTGLWANTYAMTNTAEYFAEGVQSFFSVNDHAIPSNGIHNSIDTHDELRSYDRQLFDLIQSVFPCNNNYINRCGATRQQEQAEHLRMDCNNDHAVFPAETSTCQDETVECLSWASAGACDTNPGYMRVHCRASCHTCPVDTSRQCTDNHYMCPEWANHGECQVNPGYMLVHCKHSCANCDGSKLVGR